MRKRFVLFAILPLTVVITFAALLCACEVQKMSSLKDLTMPYIAMYECTEARLDDEDYLEKFDYIRITLINKSDMEICFKPKDGDKRSTKGTYTYDKETHELQANIGILWVNYSEKTKIEKGSFVIKRSFGHKQLYMKFEMKYKYEPPRLSVAAALNLIVIVFVGSCRLLFLLALYPLPEPYAEGIDIIFQ